jgi:transposase
MIIRSTKHNATIINTGKRNAISDLLLHSKVAYSMFIDYIWNTTFNYGTDKNGEPLIFDTSKDLLDLPLFIDYKKVSYPALSARMLSTLSDQARDAVSSAIEKRRKLLYGLSKTSETNKSKLKNLNKKLIKYPLRKPGVPDDFSIEVSSRCAKFKKRESQAVYGFLTLASLGENIPKIIVPIQNHKRLRHYSDDSMWNLKGGFTISENSIQLRWERGEALKFNGSVVGGDTGFKTVLTLSDGQATPNHDKDGHSLESICQTMKRKKKGSKAFKACQDHRKNFIHWSINQLNFDGIKEVKLEEVVNINHGKKTSRLMSGWTNSIIERKVEQTLAVKDVSLTLNKSAYRSQRCFNCSLVLKANRNKKLYKCKACGYTADADLNGARNNSVDLPRIPAWLFNSKTNRSGGFFWKPEGFFALDGSELRVPDIPKDLEPN